jgi:pimeloyl-ACP methyl ester carboxylesterase
MPATTPTPADLAQGPGPLPEIPGLAVAHEFHDLPAGRFHVARIGDRTLPALLLVHGFPQHWWCWHAVAQALAGEAHLIVPDLRGAGWSPTPSGKDAYRKGALADDLLALLEAMEIDQIAVAAHDWGGYASQLLALRAPDRVSRLLAFSIPPVMPGPRPPLRALLKLNYQLVFAAPGSDQIIRRQLGRFGKSLRADVRNRDEFTREHAALYASAYADPARAKGAQSTYRSFLLGDYARISAATKHQKFQMPVRFVMAAHDGYVPAEFIVGVERTGAQVEGFTQDRTGHFVLDEDPTYVADQIREYLLPHAAPLR